GLASAPQLRRDGPLEAEPRVIARAGGAPRGPAPGAQRLFAGRGVRAALLPDVARRRRDAASSRRAAAPAGRPRPLPQRRHRSALECDAFQRRRPRPGRSAPSRTRRLATERVPRVFASRGPRPTDAQLLGVVRLPARPATPPDGAHRRSGRRGTRRRGFALSEYRHAGLVAPGAARGTGAADPMATRTRRRRAVLFHDADHLRNTTRHHPRRTRGRTLLPRRRRHRGHAPPLDTHAAKT